MIETLSFSDGWSFWERQKKSYFSDFISTMAINGFNDFLTNYTPPPVMNTNLVMEPKYGFFKLYRV